MKKILILSMSCNKERYMIEEDAIRNTLIKEINENYKDSIQFYFYRGGCNETVMYPDRNLLCLTSDDELNSTFGKTVDAFEKTINFDYDYLVRVNTSTFINLENLVSFVENIEDTGKIYLTRLLYDSAKTIFFRGNAFIMHKNLVTEIINNRKILSNTNIDDVAISYLLKTISNDNLYLLHNGLKIPNCQDYNKSFETFHNTAFIRLMNVYEDITKKDCNTISERMKIMYNYYVKHKGQYSITKPVTFNDIETPDGVYEVREVDISICITIPLLNEEPSEIEKESFLRALNIFKNRKIFTYCRNGFDVSEYKRLESLTPGAHIFNYFLPEKNMQDEESRNKMYMNSGFYSLFKDYDYMVRYDLTSYVFKDELEYFTAKDYDFVGAPIFKEYTDESGETIIQSREAGEGTFSIRKVSKMIELCNMATEEDYNMPEGEYFVGKHRKDMNVAGITDAMKFSFCDYPATLFKSNGNKTSMGGAKIMDNYDNYWKLLIDIYNKKI